MDLMNRQFLKKKLMETPAKCFSSVTDWACCDDNTKVLEFGCEIGDSATTAGCVFRPRCALYAKFGRPEACESREPSLRVLDGADAVACHFAERGASYSDDAQLADLSNAEPVAQR